MKIEIKEQLILGRHAYFQFDQGVHARTGAKNAKTQIFSLFGACTFAHEPKTFVLVAFSKSLQSEWSQDRQSAPLLPYYGSRLGRENLSGFFKSITFIIYYG